MKIDAEEFEEHGQKLIRFKIVNPYKNKETKSECTNWNRKRDELFKKFVNFDWKFGGVNEDTIKNIYFNINCSIFSSNK